MMNKLEKYAFHWEKYNFEVIGNFVHKDPANTLTLYLQMLIMQISTQTDNHKYSAETKKSGLFKKCV